MKVIHRCPKCNSVTVERVHAHKNIHDRHAADHYCGRCNLGFGGFWTLNPHTPASAMADWEEANQ